MVGNLLKMEISRKASSRTAAPMRRINAFSAITATSVLAAMLLVKLPHGEPVPPSLSTERFAVAVMAGEKQAAQEAPADAPKTEQDVTPTQEPINADVAVTDRPNSLPNAVASAQDTAPSSELHAPAQVIPPAVVSMPGGKLMANDEPMGSVDNDPFKIGPHQVYLRVFVNDKGKVTRSYIIRSGGEPLRDALILKAISSRTYSTKSLLRIDGGEPLWQLDLVLDYGTSEVLP